MIVTRRILNTIVTTRTIEGIFEMTRCIFETYTNVMMPRGHNIHNTARDMAMATIFIFTSSQHALSHHKCVLRCCGKFKIIFIPGQG